MKSEQVEVILQPVGRRVLVTPGITLLEAARQAGVELVAICGGEGICSECKVRPMSGKFSPPTLSESAELSAEELAGGVRLACQTLVLSSALVEIPPASLTTPQRLQIEGQEPPQEIDPTITAVDVVVPTAGLNDLRSDHSRLVNTVQACGFSTVKASLDVLAEISPTLRKKGPNQIIRVLLRRLSQHNTTEVELVALLDPASPYFGLAVDIGTTKLAAYLVDLTDGKTAARAGAMNPQISYGEDVISRIAFTINQPDGARTLQAALVNTLNNLVDELCTSAGVAPSSIVDAVIVGNTCMHHLFAGLPVQQLGVAPYVAALSDALMFPASQVGLNLAAGAMVYLPPNIAGYVGADHIAMLIGAGLISTDQATIALDIGTNTEISLFYAGNHWSCSCASGPAFEGAHITNGMRAAAGAIERLQIHGDKVQIKTIEDQPPVGICGSGILDTVAELRRNGLIDHRGVLKGQHPNLRLQPARGAPPSAFVLASAADSGSGREIQVTRLDINEIQLAKAAIRTGVETLLTEAGLQDDDIELFVVAGAFGTYLNLESAVCIGMFPDLPRQVFTQIGNAAGTGARRMLLSARQRVLAEHISQNVRYVELAANPAFHKHYMNMLTFP